MKAKRRVDLSVFQVSTTRNKAKADGRELKPLEQERLCQRELRIDVPTGPGVLDIAGGQQNKKTRHNP